MSTALARLVTPLPWRETRASESSRVQIWQAALDVADADLALLTTALDAAEQRRAARFRFEQDRRRFQAARGLLRHLLGTALEITPASVAFDYGPHGKPLLALHRHPPAARGRGELCFNVTHAGGWALFALAWERAVGIDLETGERLAARELAELTALSARILSARELDAWQSLPADPPAVRRAAFLRAWTRKEAYAKATGTGIFATLDRVEVALDAADPAPTLAMPGGDWTLHDLPAPAAGFAAALAVESVHPR